VLRTKLPLSCLATVTKPENILVTRGSQQALDLVARALFSDGGVIAVESMGYAPAWAAFRAAGATLVPIAVDSHGIDVAALEALCERHAVRAVYVTPHHQYPTTVTLSAPRRLALLALAKKHKLAIIEDDYDHEFHYEGRPVLPLASADSDGLVVYIATLSKLLAPGLRTGFVVGPSALVQHLAARRMYVDRQGISRSKRRSQSSSKTASSPGTRARRATHISSGATRSRRHSRRTSETVCAST